MWTTYSDLISSSADIDRIKRNGIKKSNENTQSTKTLSTNSFGSIHVCDVNLLLRDIIYVTISFQFSLLPIVKNAIVRNDSPYSILFYHILSILNDGFFYGKFEVPIYSNKRF